MGTKTVPGGVELPGNTVTVPIFSTERTEVHGAAPPQPKDSPPRKQRGQDASWDRTHLACTCEASCTPEACAPRNPGYISFQAAKNLPVSRTEILCFLSEISVSSV